jgi:hypothetical protein
MNLKDLRYSYKTEASGFQASLSAVCLRPALLFEIAQRGVPQPAHKATTLNRPTTCMRR